MIRMDCGNFLGAWGVFFLPVLEGQSATSEIRVAQAGYDLFRRASLPGSPRRRGARYPNYEPTTSILTTIPARTGRECNATYVQEFRPSGTVIVPHMSCIRRG